MLLVGQYFGSVIVTDEVVGVPTTPLAQWISCRSRSSASRPFCWARKRLLMSACAFDAERNNCVSAATTMPRIASTTIISLSVKPPLSASRPRRRAIRSTRTPF